MIDSAWVREIFRDFLSTWRSAVCRYEGLNFVVGGNGILSIEVGSILEGTVSGITKFGAFIELPENKTGLVHISEVAGVYVNDVNDFLKQGQKIKVKVLAINENGRIGLSVKQVPENKTVQAAAASRGECSHTGEQRDSFADRHNRPSHPKETVSARSARQFMGGGFSRSGGRFSSGSMSFEDKLSKFLKDSDERLTDLKRKLDSKRGGRGSRRGD